MAGAVAGGVNKSVEKGGLTFSIAGSDDEAEMRELLRTQPLPGWVTVSFEREPNYFAAARIDGERHSVLLARDTKTERLAGFYSRSVRRVYINGEIKRLGYVSQLRVNKGYASGYRVYRHFVQGFSIGRTLLSGEDELDYDITSILADNRPAKRLLSANLPGMPRYELLSGYNTLVFRAGGIGRKSSEYQVESGKVSGLEAIVRCLQRNNSRYQFAPFWDEASLVALGLDADDFLVVRDGERVTACLSLWDQRSVKQAVVRGYKKPVRRLRPLINAFSPCLGIPRLPPVGETLRIGWLSHLASEADAPGPVRALLVQAIRRARKMGLEQLMLGLADEHPLLATVRSLNRHMAYRSDLYLVVWPDREADASMPDLRPPHLEVATL